MHTPLYTSGHFAQGFCQSEFFIQLQMSARYEDGHFRVDIWIFFETTLKCTVEWDPADTLTYVTVLPRPARLTHACVVADQVAAGDGVHARPTLTFVGVELTEGALPLGGACAHEAGHAVCACPAVSAGVGRALVDTCGVRVKTFVRGSLQALPGRQSTTDLCGISFCLVH